ncbi:MAG: proline dehydrogenase family protein [Bryobacterales bacterium]|nr:proline dehydrogenase family protein [Bryobacterales bacterium]
MLRSAILLASESQVLRGWMERSRHARALTRRFVAGTSLEEAISAVRELDAVGLRSSLDALGESVGNQDEAVQATAGYVASVQRIADLRLPATISLKLTQLGLDISPSLCRQHLTQIVNAARGGGIRVEVDMEASVHVDATLELVHAVHRASGGVRAVIQAYLHRSEADIHELNRAGVPVRLCKGAYKEGPRVAIARKSDVDANFERLAALLLREGKEPAIATHDERMIRSALDVIQAEKLNPACYEFQMLYGIRRDLQARLAGDGHSVRIYIPYGDAWYPYLMRRMAERPANLLFVLRNLIG